jgi:chemotaxis protein CheD
MYRYDHLSFNKSVVVIDPGEYYATGEDILISTVLGSCVSVVLFDRVLGLGGINHYMLPGAMDGRDYARASKVEQARYGLHAMEQLLARLSELGSSLRKLEAKVFGGGAVLRLTSRSRLNVSQDNVDFALSYLEKKGIPILATDVLGTQGRKLFFEPNTFKVKVKRLTATAAAPVIETEKEIIEEELPT